MKGARRPATVYLIAAAVVVTGAQKREWFDLYDEAIKHVQAQEWEQAEPKLLQARQEGPPSGRSVLRYGSLRPPFFPEFYLGIVYLSTDRPKEALQQFQLARKNNIPRNPEFGNISVLEGVAKNNLTKMMAAGPATPPPPKVVKPEDKPPVSGPVFVPPVNYLPQFAELMTTARNLLGQKNFDGAEQSATAARDHAIKYSLTAERPRAESLLREIAGARFAAAVEAALERRDAQAARSQLIVLAAAAPEYPLDALRARVETLERELRRTELYRSAMRAFFDGNYQQSLTLLAEAEKQAALTARGHFYRACSLAALAAATPNPSQDRRLADAKRSYSAAESSRKQFEQDLRYISPKIRQLLGIP